MQTQHTILQQAYHCYKRNNLVNSQRSFSTQILGKPKSYYSCMIARNRAPSPAVLKTLLAVTKTITASFIGNPHYGKSYAANLNKAHEQLKELSERVTMEIELVNVAKELEG